MIALPELLIVLGVIALMIGYVAFLRHLLAHMDDGDPDATKITATGR